MGAVRSDRHFPGMFRNLISKTLPERITVPPKTLVEALALDRPFKIKRALRENPKLMEERGSWGETPLHWMARANDWKTASILFDCGIEVDARDDSNEETALHYAATEGNRKVMNVLVRAGADLNAQNKDGDTPLHWACHGGHYDSARYLLNEGADPRIQNLEGVDCLDMGRNMNHTRIAKLIQGNLDRTGG